jgi:hypothetical protein
MRNRAKCKLCNIIIESFHPLDYVDCKCGEISVSGGDSIYGCSARSWENFLRIDDDDNEIIITVKNPDKPVESILKTPDKQELIDMLDEMVKSIDNLPDQAKYTSINQYDLYSALLLISEILKKL